MSFGCPSHLSASEIRWDSIKPLVSFFSLNLLDTEMFLSIPYLLPDTWMMSGTAGDLSSLRTQCCAAVTTAVTNRWAVRMKKNHRKMFVPVHGTHGIPKCWQVLLSPGSLLGLADLIPAFQAQAQNTQSRPLILTLPSLAGCLIIKSVQKYLSDKAQSWLNCKVNWKLLERLLHGDKRLTSLFTASSEEVNWNKFFSSTHWVPLRDQGVRTAEEKYAGGGRSSLSLSEICVNSPSMKDWHWAVKSAFWIWQDWGFFADIHLHC